MKKILLSTVLGVGLLALAFNSAWAEDVLITKSGKKYHHVESAYAQKDGVEKISVEEATERGLTPSKDYLKRKAAKESEPAK